MSGSFSTAYSGPKSAERQPDRRAARSRPDHDASIKKVVRRRRSARRPDQEGQAVVFHGRPRVGRLSSISRAATTTRRRARCSTRPIRHRLSHNNEYFSDISLRLTWQAAQKHKIVFSYSSRTNCSCPFGLLGVGGANGRQAGARSAGEHIYNPNVPAARQLELSRPPTGSCSRRARRPIS